MTRKTDQRVTALAWVLAIAGLLILLVAYAEPKKNASIVDDSAVPTEFFKQVQAKRYLNHAASFTTNKDAKLELAIPADTESVVFRVWDYPNHSVAINAEREGLLRRVETPGKGLSLMDLSMKLEGLAGEVLVTFELPEGAAFLFDSISYVSAGPSLGSVILPSILTLCTFLIMLIGSRMVHLAVPSTGQVYPSIDIMRALAVLLVVILHTRGYVGYSHLYGDRWFDALSAHGHFGV
jgi:hypothetical protein